MAKLLNVCIFVFISALGGCSSSFPQCDSSDVESNVTQAIHDAYTEAGLPNGFSSLFLENIDDWDDLVEAEGQEFDSIKRVLSNSLKLNSSDDVKMCRFEIGEGSYMVVSMVRSPDNADIGFVVYNIGRGDLVGSSGWVSRLN